MIAPIELRLAVEDLYADYAEIIDDGKLERWPDLFADPCLYRIVSKENHDRGLPLSLMHCEGQGMLKDRAFASKELNVYAPRSWRHSITQIRIKGTGNEFPVHANFVVFETVVGNPTQILCAGRYLDTLVRVGGDLKFREKICVYDTTIIPGSVVFPL